MKNGSFFKQQIFLAKNCMVKVLIFCISSGQDIFVLINFGHRNNIKETYPTQAFSPP